MVVGVVLVEDDYFGGVGGCGVFGFLFEVVGVVLD